MNRTPSLQNILHAMEDKGYKVFTDSSKPYNLNIVGVRSKNTQAGEFDDRLIVFWSTKEKWDAEVFRITTDPGLPYLYDPINSDGCAILVPNQYRGAYAIDLHNGQYYALCQRLGPVQVYRDDNRDSVLDYEAETIQTGHFGINIHRASASGEAESVGRYSAGCQVFQNYSDFQLFMQLCDEARKSWGNAFTYTLLEQKDIAP